MGILAFRSILPKAKPPQSITQFYHPNKGKTFLKPAVSNNTVLLLTNALTDRHTAAAIADASNVALSLASSTPNGYMINNILIGSTQDGLFSDLKVNDKILHISLSNGQIQLGNVVAEGVLPVSMIVGDFYLILRPITWPKGVIVGL